MTIQYIGIKPNRATDGSAGHDLQAAQSVMIYPGETQAIKTGLRTKMPRELVALVFIRSGCARRGLQLANSVAVIDSDYLGEWILLVRNTGNDPYLVSEGDRIAQAVFVPWFAPEFEQVEALEATVRGDGGFGSTGR